MKIKINRQELMDLEKNLKEQIKDRIEYDPIEEFFDSSYPEHKQTTELIQLENHIDGVSHKMFSRIAKIIKHQMIDHMQETESGPSLDEFIGACYNVLDIDFELIENEPTHGVVTQVEVTDEVEVVIGWCPSCRITLLPDQPLCACGFRIDQKDK